MSKINDGGPAFPSGWLGQVGPAAGMSLRDWFAATINLEDVEFPTIAVAANFVGVPEPAGNDHEASLRLSAAVQAKLRYMIADAMLSARAATLSSEKEG